MKRHLYLVFTNAVEGHEDELNEWYTRRHFLDMLQLDGFEAAQRFEIDPDVAELPFRYLVIYEVPEDKLEAAKQSLRDNARERSEALAAGREPRIPVSPLVANMRSFWCHATTDLFEAES